MSPDGAQQWDIRENLGIERLGEIETPDLRAQDLRAQTSESGRMPLRGCGVGTVLIQSPSAREPRAYPFRYEWKRRYLRTGMTRPPSG